VTKLENDRSHPKTTAFQRELFVFSISSGKEEKKTDAPRCIAITPATTTVVTDGILWLYKPEKGHAKKEGGIKKTENTDRNTRGDHKKTKNHRE
jgi:hypothetical protein